MKPEEMYQHLKDLADRLGITVLEQNLGKSGFPVQSGFCIVKSKKFFFLDKRKSTLEKNILIASLLEKIIKDDIYIVPAVRDFIQTHAE